MTKFQSTDEFNGLLEGRTLRFILTGTESKSGRPLSAALQDVETGEVIALMAPVRYEPPRHARRRPG
jgi:hypothetical protein